MSSTVGVIRPDEGVVGGRSSAAGLERDAPAARLGARPSWARRQWIEPPPSVPIAIGAMRRGECRALCAAADPPGAQHRATGWRCRHAELRPVGQHLVGELRQVGLADAGGAGLCDTPRPRRASRAARSRPSRPSCCTSRAGHRDIVLDECIGTPCGPSAPPHHWRLPACAAVRGRLNRAAAYANSMSEGSSRRPAPARHPIDPRPARDRAQREIMAASLAAGVKHSSSSRAIVRWVALAGSMILHLPSRSKALLAHRAHTVSAQATLPGLSLPRRARGM